MIWLRNTLLLATLIAVAILLAWVFRSDPIGPLSGKALSGQAMPIPATWPTCEQTRELPEDEELAIEMRPDDPYSVTTWYLIYENTLFVPAQYPEDKDWPKYVEANANIKVKLCGQLFEGRARRAFSYPQSVLIDALIEKYPTYLGDDLRTIVNREGLDVVRLYEVYP